MTTSSSPSNSDLEQSTSSKDRERTADCSVTIVIPTFNEAANIEELMNQIAAAIAGEQDMSVVFVDDSTDSTQEVIREAAARFPVHVSLYHRPEPVGGLGGAVMEGIARTESRWIVVMDADLQHPPSLLSRLIAQGEGSGAGLIVASRYKDGGSASGLDGRYRVLVSHASRSVAKTLFPRLLRGVSDPLSGYFAIRRDVVDRAQRNDALRPLGYKILLELIVRCRPLTMTEVAYEFGPRRGGESTSTFREGLRFLRHLFRLRTSGAPSRALALGMVGLSGFLPNLAVLWALTHHTALHYTAAEVIANQFGLLWNFVLIDKVLYHGRKRLDSWMRLLGFAALANADLMVRIPLMVLLVSGFGFTPVPATAITLAVAFALRFLCVDRFLYRRIGGSA
ncbi:glycosyltransferase family 2 protein [Streptomyces sp. WAC01526]|uniref:glycosyltransferase n=1 Tax=Streptomyces sp. WAC01526 TaxID=2588709 RepID=UPI0021CCEA78|nr:glycosyltransferase family 2 protein [Streptomyces sp. WAC01526]